MEEDVSGGGCVRKDLYYYLPYSRHLHCYIRNALSKVHT